MRTKLSEEPLLTLRENVLFLLDMVTDLSRYQSHVLEVGTPSYHMLERAILDSFYRGSEKRVGMFLFNWPLINFCVGFSSPIDFNPGAMTNLLADVQRITHDVLDIFSRQYFLPSQGDPGTANLRKQMEETLNREVLPKIDVNLMSIGAMERHFGEHVYINNSTATTPQMIGAFTPETPYVFVL